MKKLIITFLALMFIFPFLVSAQNAEIYSEVFPGYVADSDFAQTIVYNGSAWGEFFMDNACTRASAARAGDMAGILQELEQDRGIYINLEEVEEEDIVLGVNDSVCFGIRENPRSVLDLFPPLRFIHVPVETYMVEGILKGYCYGHRSETCFRMADGQIFDWNVEKWACDVLVTYGNSTYRANKLYHLTAPDECAGVENMGACAEGYCCGEVCKQAPSCEGCKNNSYQCVDGELLCGFELQGTNCSDDGKFCTNDVCDGNGSCAHLPKPEGTICSLEINCNGTELCTQIVCDGQGNCNQSTNCSECPISGGVCGEESCSNETDYLDWLEDYLDEDNGGTSNGGSNRRRDSDGDDSSDGSDSNGDSSGNGNGGEDDDDADYGATLHLEPADESEGQFEFAGFKISKFKFYLLLGLVAGGVIVLLALIISFYSKPKEFS